MRILIIICVFGLGIITTFGQDQMDLIGRWEMDKVIQNENDVTKEHNPKQNRFFVFFDDGTFESGGDPYGKNTGKYFYNKSKKQLMIDSDLGPGDDSMWNLSFEKEKMIWNGVGSDWAEQFVVIHRRSSL